MIQPTDEHDFIPQPGSNMCVCGSPHSAYELDASVTEVSPWRAQVERAERAEAEVERLRSGALAKVCCWPLPHRDRHLCACICTLPRDHKGKHQCTVLRSTGGAA